MCVRVKATDDGGIAIRFDPVTNPADERLLWEWAERKGLSTTLRLNSDGRFGCTVVKFLQGLNVTAVGRGNSQSRVTALMLAVDALPEDV